MAPLRRTHGRPPGMSSRCQPSATPSLRSVECSGARQNYRCPGQAKRPSKFPLLCCSAWSTPSATPPDATHFGPFGEMLNRSAQIMAGGKSRLGQRTDVQLWRTILLWRVLPDIFGAAWWLALIALAGSFYRRRDAMAVAVLVVAFLTPFVVFTNLHIVHNYYQYANAAFIVAALQQIAGQLGQA